MRVALREAEAQLQLAEDKKDAEKATKNGELARSAKRKSAVGKRMQALCQEHQSLQEKPTPILGQDKATEMLEGFEIMLNCPMV